MNKFLHEPSVRLKTAAANGRGLGVVDAARYLFALGEKGDSPSTEHTDSTTKPPDAPLPERTDLNG